MVTVAGHDSTARGRSGAVQLPSVGALLDPGALEEVLGPVEQVAAEVVQTDGTTEAVHRRVRARLRTGETLALWLKQVRLTQDWTALGSGDPIGREAELLADPRLSSVWCSFHRPYRAFAVERGEYGLLMDDLGEHRLVRSLSPAPAPIAYSPRPQCERSMTEAEEDAILAAMAGLHARYWDSELARLPWLQSPWHRLYFLGPRYAEGAEASPNDALGAGRADRWSAALARLPRAVASLLFAPTEDLAMRCAGLPWTVYHGDLKLANLALLPGGGLAAYDWGLIGGGPATLDLGWHLFRSWRFRARAPDAVVGRYRELLEAQLGARLPEALWGRLIEVGLLCGAIMATIELVHALERGVAGAAEEWDWRVAQLERLT